MSPSEHPTPWSIRSTRFGESIGYDSRSAIFDADGNHIVTIGNGSSRQVAIAEKTATDIVSAMNAAHAEPAPNFAACCNSSDVSVCDCVRKKHERVTYL